MKLKHSLRIAIILTVSYFSLNIANAQNDVWQWSVSVRNFSKSPKNPESTAYLWIPEKCKKINAILIAQHNMEEISILQNAGFRKKMSGLNVAMIWVNPSFNHGFNFTDGAGETLNAILHDLAEESGYNDISTAPLIAIGHSAAASWPYYLAAYMPERTLACISVSGQWPYHRDKWLCHDIWGDRNIDYIPCLETMGEYEAAHTWSDEGLKEKNDHPLLPLSMLACPAEGHFATSDKKCEYIALFISKAIKYGHINPQQNGWLMERWKKDTAPSTKPAHVKDYKGDKKEAFWFFDKEMIDATINYQSRFRNMKAQLVDIIQQGERVIQKNSHLQVHPQFITDDDGLTISLKPIFADTVSGRSPRLSNWTGMNVGAKIGHSNSGMPYLEIISGPGIIKNNSIQIKWSREIAWEQKKAEIVFAIKHHGDKIYKPAVQQAQINIPVRQKGGKSQVINFRKMENINIRTKKVPLIAFSTSALPVSFYVKAGPAYIKNNTLILTKIPPKAKYPIKVTVVAWQYGITGKIRTAEPVVQTILITQ